ncbi:MAG TPA: hypothetical protein DEQ34_02520, partial [Balneolaceae bacterium]|nr:hypothetical protein [Balneolaceae bacterium]
KPHSSMALHELTLTYNTVGNYEKSIEYAQIGQKVDSESRYLFYHMQGIALDYLGKPEEAIKAFKEGIQINDTSYFLHYSLAITSLNQGYVNQAITSLQNSIMTNYGHASSHLLLARIYKDQQRNVPALLAYTYFLFYEPDSQRRLDAYDEIQEIFEMAEKGEDGQPVNVTVNLFGALGDGMSIAELSLSMHSTKRFKEEYEGVPTIEFIADGYEVLIGALPDIEDDKEPSFEQEVYIPYLKQVHEAGYTHAMVYLIFENSLLNGVTDWINENWEICEEFLEWEPADNESD